ncbi:hypothetical protein NMY22_g5170 [Coprinellus aureogranulatus]|nr:hypothetical protein NMY22_g5170 [Coprinellus aureogranulatus]
MDPATIQRIVQVYETARVRSLALQAGNMALLYHYATSFDEEVAHIWTQPRMKLGKALFLIARYSSILSITVSILSNSPNYANLSVHDCTILSRVYDVLRPVSSTSAEAMLWVCLYALLEGKRIYLYFLAAIFFGITIPGQILTWINSSRAFNVAPDPFGEELGFPCNWDTTYYNQTLLTASAYLALTRALIAFIVGAVTLAKRYRKHNNLITVIIREGGIYYTSACILILINGLMITPGFPARDRYQISAILRWTFVFVFSDRLLLKLQTIKDPGTRGVVSTLLFAHEKSDEVLDVSTASARWDEGNTSVSVEECQTMGTPGMEDVEKRGTARVDLHQTSRSQRGHKKSHSVYTEKVKNLRWASFSSPVLIAPDPFFHLEVGTSRDRASRGWYRRSPWTMSLSEEEILSLAEDVTAWRLDEVGIRFQDLGSVQDAHEAFLVPFCVPVSFTTLYFYYVLTTIDEEVSIIFPQRWNGGKTLFMVIRYGTFAYVALHLSGQLRITVLLESLEIEYLSWMLSGIPKLLYDKPRVVFHLVLLACNISLGLCVGALLHAGRFLLLVIMIIAAASDVINGLIFEVAGFVQYPAEPITDLDRELGYPCYVLSTDVWISETITGLGFNVRIYLGFATTCLLIILALATIVLRYRGQNGRFIQVLRRDGGIYYLALAGQSIITSHSGTHAPTPIHEAIRLADAIVNTPGILPEGHLYSSPAVLLVLTMDKFCIPILAQRLMINLRKIDFEGSRPIASKILFAPRANDLSDELRTEDDPGSSIVLDSVSSGARVEQEGTFGSHLFLTPYDIEPGALGLSSVVQ